MKSAEAFVEALSRGVAFNEAWPSLPSFDLRYFSKVPAEIYIFATQLGWRFFPTSKSNRSYGAASLFRHATSDLDLLRRWARGHNDWAVATGALSGVLVLEVHGNEGRQTLLELCGDDWDWLDTVRSTDGIVRYLFFAWPFGQMQLHHSSILGSGLRIIGENGWVPVPPSRGLKNRRHVYLNPVPRVADAPAWLINAIAASGNALPSTGSQEVPNGSASLLVPARTNSHLDPTPDSLDPCLSFAAY